MSQRLGALETVYSADPRWESSGRGLWGSRLMAVEHSRMILALDLSTSIGWAVGHIGDRIPKWGVWELPGPAETFGRRFNAFENCVLDAFEEHRPYVVYVERPIPQRNNNVVTAELTYGIHSILALHCFRHDIPLERPSADMIRNAVMGRSKLTAEEKAARLKTKPTIVNPWIAEMGWHEIGHPDAKDAAAVWAYATGIRAPRPPRAKRKAA